MSLLFYGLNIAKNTLSAQTQVLNVTAHNVANANTPGYSKQTVELAAVNDNPMSGLRTSTELNIGSGVVARSVARSRSVLYDTIYRKENQNYNSYSVTEDLLNQVELLFNEPSDTGLSSTLNEFFNGWQDVASNPQNMAARQSLKSIGEELADRLHRIYNQLLTMRQNIDSEISTIPASINEIAREIAALNGTIRTSEIQGTAANDLRDNRDNLLDELSKFTDMQVAEQNNGTITVIAGSKVIVEQDRATELYAVSSTLGGRNIRKTVIRSKDGTDYVPTEGKLGAFIKFRDEMIEDIISKFDTLSESLVNAVNFEHQSGYGLDGGTGWNFFEPNNTKAFNISVSNDVEDVSHIAASKNGDRGDGANAFKINELSSLKLVNNQFSLGEYYNATISDIGIWAKNAKSSRTNEELLINQIDNAREGVKGVNIDEELITMIQTQHIYQGASRLIVTLDSLLETLMGIK